MRFLIFSILCSVIVANLLKLFSIDKSISTLYLFLGNYLVASIMGFIFSFNTGYSLNLSDIILSIISGLFFLLGFIFFMKNISVNGLSISVSTFRISLIIPVIGSLLLFKEFLSIVNYLGIILILISFLLLGDAKKQYKIGLLVLLFFIAGFSDFFPRIFKQYGHHNPDSLFLFLNFLFAFFFNIIFIAAKKAKFSFSSLIFGFFLGVPNFLTTLFLMKAFNNVPATLAYPILSSGTVILTMSSDYLFWKKRFTKKEYFIYSLILAGIILTVLSF